MMTNRIIALITFVLILSGFQGLAQQIDCYPFKEGKFRINDSRIGGVVIADRRGGIQVETIETLKLSVQFKVTWQSDCNYTLTFDKIIRNENKVPVPSNMIVKVKIVASRNNSSYAQETTSSVNRGTYRSEVTKIQ